MQTLTKYYSSDSYANQNETYILKTNGTRMNDGLSQEKTIRSYNHTAVSTAVWWWLRSCPYTNTTSFRPCYTDGGNNNNNAYYSAGLRPGFYATGSNGVTEK